MLMVTRAYDFSASHRLHAAGLSATENQELFGKCNWENGHGHNYALEVTFAGETDPRTGLLFDPSAVDRIVDEEVLTPLDHRNLNVDVPELAGVNPTSENVTRAIWDRLAARLANDGPFAARLYRVALRETARNCFEYFGPDEPVLERASR